MIDPTRTAERQYDAIAQIIEREGFVKDKIVSALRDVIAGEASTAREAIIARNFRPSEHYTPIPWDAVTNAAKQGGPLTRWHTIADPSGLSRCVYQHGREKPDGTIEWKEAPEEYA